MSKKPVHRDTVQIIDDEDDVEDEYQRKPVGSSKGAGGVGMGMGAQGKGMFKKPDFMKGRGEKVEEKEEKMGEREMSWAEKQSERLKQRERERQREMERDSERQREIEIQLNKKSQHPHPLNEWQQLSSSFKPAPPNRTPIIPTPPPKPQMLPVSDSDQQLPSPPFFDYRQSVASTRPTHPAQQINIINDSAFVNFPPVVGAKYDLPAVSPPKPARKPIKTVFAQTHRSPSPLSPRRSPSPSPPAQLQRNTFGATKMSPIRAPQESAINYQGAGMYSSGERFQDYSLLSSQSHYSGKGPSEREGNPQHTGTGLLKSKKKISIVKEEKTDGNFSLHERSDWRNQNIKKPTLLWKNYQGCPAEIKIMLNNLAATYGVLPKLTPPAHRPTPSLPLPYNASTSPFTPTIRPVLHHDNNSFYRSFCLSYLHLSLIHPSSLYFLRFLMLFANPERTPIDCCYEEGMMSGKEREERERMKEKVRAVVVNRLLVVYSYRVGLEGERQEEREREGKIGRVLEEVWNEEGGWFDEGVVAGVKGVLAGGRVAVLEEAFGVKVRIWEEGQEMERGEGDEVVLYQRGRGDFDAVLQAGRGYNNYQ